MATKGSSFEVLGIGAFLPEATLIEGSLRAGQVGYFIANLKSKGCKIGDTVTTVKHPAKEPLEGFKEIKPVVFAGIYPIDSSDFYTLKDALGRLQLNDSALTIEQESSHSLGFGFRCGFLGLLHLEIIFERISREFDLDIIATAPSVIYKVVLKMVKPFLLITQQHILTQLLLNTWRSLGSMLISLRLKSISAIL